MQSIIVPGSHARAVRVGATQTVRVVNTHGTQVVDFWALRADRPEIAHVDAALADPVAEPATAAWRRDARRGTLDDPHPRRGHQPGGSRHGDRRVRPVPLRATGRCSRTTARVAPTSPRPSPSSRSCAARPVPAPLNLFMNIPWDLDGNITFEPTVSAAGDSVSFRAEVDVIVIASACPMDIVPINGPGGGTPVDVELIVS